MHSTLQPPIHPLGQSEFWEAAGLFCAGRDVSESPTDRDLELVQAVARSIVDNPKPIVAAVHRWTVGAGFEWMLNADIVYPSEDARFKLPEASLGVIATGGLVATLPAAIGLTRAKALMLLGEFSAAQAADWGLVYQVLPNEELDAITLAEAPTFIRSSDLFGAPRKSASCNRENPQWARCSRLSVTAFR